VPLASMTPRITIGANAVRIASGVFGLVFLALVATQLLTTDGGVRVALVATSATSALLCLSLRRVSRAISESWTERLLVTLCVVPLVNIFLSLTLTHRIEQTAVLMLALVGIGAITVRLRQPVVLTALSGAGWLVLVLVQQPAPTATIVRYALQLALAAVLAGVVFSIRASSSRDLARVSHGLSEQVRELAHAREDRELTLRRYRSLFHDGPLGVTLTDEAGVFVEINPALEALLARPAAEILGRSPQEFTHPDDRHVNDGAARLMDESEDGVARLENRYVRPDGEIRWVTVSVTRVDGPAGRPWALAHIQDITERKSLELDVLHSRDRIRAAAEIASAAQRGDDPRPVAAEHLRRLVGAAHVCVVERLDERTLGVTASDGQDWVGTTLDLSEHSASADVWRSGEPLFVSQAASSSRVNGRLNAVSGSASLMWQPIGRAAVTEAILVIGWDDTIDAVGEEERAVVADLAVELGAALVGERLRLQLEEQSVVDPLTGLLNRRGWDRGLRDLLEHGRLSGLPFVLAVADLDNFKQFNDEFGHLEGDVLLSDFAANAEDAVRDIDLIARWGGEEFAIALRDCDLDAALPVLERVRTAVPAGRTCSIGYAVYDPQESPIECLRRVDEALYRAKAAGRNRVEPAVPVGSRVSGIVA
jgi:diguanylate cyclase (GGDEF)-like protein/PAS domain S-box-containing protein